jgi:hypothetical protein
VAEKDKFWEAWKTKPQRAAIVEAYDRFVDEYLGGELWVVE